MRGQEKRRLMDTVVWTVSIMFGVLVCVHEAHAGEPAAPGRDVLAAGAAAAARPDPVPRDPAEARYVAECGSCHIAYPPGLLPAAHWQGVLAQLDRHYGVDASLEAPQRRALSTWLARRAGARADPGGAPGAAPRITTTGWFVREHREVPARTWKLAQVGSAARCEACHSGAENGDFDEHGVRLPR
jgi:hypothetical protein